MNVQNIPSEVAVDLIGLVNSLKGITYDANVEYQTKSGIKKFDYVTLDKIYSIVKENNNFAVMEPLGTNDNGESALQVLLIHKSGYSIVSDYYKIRVNENGSKQDEGAVITYTKRYALGSILGICTDQDNDANPNGEGTKLKQQNNSTQSKSTLSDAQVNRLYAIAKKAGISQTQVCKVIFTDYKKTDPRELTKSEYDTVCERIEKKVGAPNGNQ